MKLDDKLGDNQLAILRLIQEKPEISITEMAKKIGISTTSIEKNLKKMRGQYIRRIGPDKGGHWEVVIKE